jgi:hypothetical protein
MNRTVPRTRVKIMKYDNYMCPEIQFRFHGIHPFFLPLNDYTNDIT